jgi:hypothetical protein
LEGTQLRKILKKDAELLRIKQSILLFITLALFTIAFSVKTESKVDTVELNTAELVNKAAPAHKAPAHHNKCKAAKHEEKKAFLEGPAAVKKAKHAVKVACHHDKAHHEKKAFTEGDKHHNKCKAAKHDAKKAFLEGPAAAKKAKKHVKVACHHDKAHHEKKAFTEGDKHTHNKCKAAKHEKKKAFLEGPAAVKKAEKHVAVACHHANPHHRKKAFTEGVKHIKHCVHKHARHAKKALMEGHNNAAVEAVRHLKHCAKHHHSHHRKKNLMESPKHKHVKKVAAKCAKHAAKKAHKALLEGPSHKKAKKVVHAAVVCARKVSKAAQKH